MIYTVTLNPSIDYIVSVPEFSVGKTNRTAKEWMNPGGKGINVSLVLKNLGVESIALGFLAGFTGEEIRKRVKEAGLKEEFITVQNGVSRINYKLKSDTETEINGMGPEILPKEMEQFFAQIEKLTSSDCLVLSGSVPKFAAGKDMKGDKINQTSLLDSQSGIYCEIMKRCKEKGVRIVVDASGESLRKTLEYRPFLIKPNQAEVEELFGVTIESKEDAVIYGKKLKESGAQRVLISMGSKGAVYIGENAGYLCDAPKGTLVNSVGAGDSMVAGYLQKILETCDEKEAFLQALCAGSASAFHDGFAKKQWIEELKSQTISRLISFSV